MSPAGVSRTVLREQVKDILLQRIASGELQPGERLFETRIAQELGTSQGPVREALRDLELLRLVESEPFRGARVRVFDDASLREIYPVRAALEELAAQLATARLEGDVTELEEEIEHMRDAVAQGDLGALTRHDIAFHRRLVEAAGNDALERCWSSLAVGGHITLVTYEMRVSPADAPDTHVPIVEAIRLGDPVRAGREVRVHIERYAVLLPAPIEG